MDTIHFPSLIIGFLMAIIPYLVKKCFSLASKERSIAKNLYFILHYYFLNETNNLDNNNIITKLLVAGSLLNDKSTSYKDEKLKKLMNLLKKDSDVNNQLMSMIADIKNLPNELFKLEYEEIKDIEARVEKYFSWDEIDIMNRPISDKLYSCKYSLLRALKYCRIMMWEIRNTAKEGEIKIQISEIIKSLLNASEFFVPLEEYSKKIMNMSTVRLFLRRLKEYL